MTYRYNDRIIDISEKLRDTAALYGTVVREPLFESESQVTQLIAERDRLSSIAAANGYEQLSAEVTGLFKGTDPADWEAAEVFEILRGRVYGDTEVIPWPSRTGLPDVEPEW